MSASQTPAPASLALHPFSIVLVGGCDERSPIPALPDPQVACPFRCRWSRFETDFHRALRLLVPLDLLPLKPREGGQHCSIEDNLGKIPWSLEGLLRRVTKFTMEARLKQVSEKREMPWRPEVDPITQIETGGEERRKHIRLAHLLATRGQVQIPPCQHCANGYGKFKVCVALANYFKGACASCRLNGRPDRCSVKNSEGRRHHEAYEVYEGALIVEPSSLPVPPTTRIEVRDRPLSKSSIKQKFGHY